ncbi:MAG: VanW family protein [Acutalibacteraceae bacterium]
MANSFGSGGYRFDSGKGDELNSDGYYDDNGFDDDFDDNYYDDYDADYDEFSDDFDDDYAAARSDSGNGNYDEFDDDFDDDYYDDYDNYDDYGESYGRGSSYSSRGYDDDGYGVNYDDFEEKSYYSGERRSQSAARNVVPEQQKQTPRRRETQSERYDRYAEDLKKKRKHMGAPTGTTGDFYDYDTSDDYDDYDDADGYYGRDYGPADRTPEPIPPIYAKYLGYGNGGYQGGDYQEEGKTARKNHSISLASHRARKRLKSLGIVMGCLLVVMIGVYYFGFVRMYNPVEVSNSIVNLQTAETTKMMQSVVGEKLSDKTIRMIVNGETFTINLGEYGFNYSASADGSTTTTTVKGEDGKEQEQVIATYKNICYNQTKLEALLDSIAGKYGTIMQKPSYTIEDEKLIIKAGTDGVGIDENSLMGQILARIQSGNYEENLVEEMVVTKTPAVNIDSIYKEVVCDVKDASSYVDSNGETVYSPDVVGKKFDLEAARAKIAKGGNTWTITMKLTQPEVTLVELKAPTCPDLLAETTTTFNAGNKTRAANIKNAAKRINTYGSFEDGYVMQPGEIFSFNDVVGERTEANGFSIATVYTTSGTANDVGGGICQVSSTIFSAVFKADLGIVSRTNHMYIVHYWPTKGEDATVNWGTIDFKFQNTKSYPVKIKLIYSNEGKLTCQVYGTDDGYRAEFDNKVIKQVLTGVVTKKATSSKPAGTIEYGDPGYTIEIYKVRYNKDVKVSRELMWTSVYQPLQTVKYVN